MVTIFSNPLNLICHFQAFYSTLGCSGTQVFYVRHSPNLNSPTVMEVGHNWRLSVNGWNDNKLGTATSPWSPFKRGLDGKLMKQALNQLSSALCIINWYEFHFLLCKPAWTLELFHSLAFERSDGWVVWWLHQPKFTSVGLTLYLHKQL